MSPPNQYSESLGLQMLKTMDAMRLRTMTVEKFNSLKYGMGIQHLNTRLHQRILYRTLKSIDAREVHVSLCTRILPRFPRFTVSLEKQKAVHKIGGLPPEIIRVINEYAFERMEEVCYSLFHLSIDIYKVFDLNISIMNHVSRANSRFHMFTHNCQVCGGYIGTKTTGISPRVICGCDTHS